MNKPTLESFTAIVKYWEESSEKERKRQAKEQKERNKLFYASPFGKIIKKLTLDEYTTWSSLMLCGMWDYSTNTVLMGSDSYERVKKYEDELLIKYGK